MAGNRITLAILLLLCGSAYGQDKWDLVRCVDFALKNNISVKQTDVQSRFSALAYQQSKAAKLPTLNFSSSVGYRLGRSENPTTGVLEDNTLFNLGMQVQSGVTIFNWFSQKNTIEANRLSWEADKEQIKKVQNDVALNVAVAYLQILLAREQINLARIQIEQTGAQLANTRKRVDAGVLPELNAAELEAQLSRDSSTFVSAEATAAQMLLQMKALLNLDAGVPFDVLTPPVDNIPVIPLAELQPEAVYISAISILPQQKVNNLKLESAAKSVAAAKGAMYPTISAFGGLNASAISFRKKPIYDQVFTGYAFSGARANAGGGVYYQVEVPQFQQGTTVLRYIRSGSLLTQLRNNFGQNFGIGISVPISNGRAARTAWDRSKLVVQQLQLEKESADMQLKQDIYKAYNDATAALQKFNADSKSVQTAEKAYDYASKRYALNLLSTYDLITSQNNVQKAKVQLLYSRYDYVFKMKLLEFYRGQGLKL
ncbi:MAG: TolC family protein [Chitinophagaceae bacterium]|nr:TolC family protein [Chitinophagaceae bacterium]